jgi:hypothetical protein
LPSTTAPRRRAAYFLNHAISGIDNMPSDGSFSSSQNLDTSQVIKRVNGDNHTMSEDDDTPLASTTFLARIFSLI